MYTSFYPFFFINFLYYNCFLPPSIVILLSIHVKCQSFDLSRLLSDGSNNILKDMLFVWSLFVILNYVL